MSHLEFEGRRLPHSFSKLDQAVADYINHLYQEGEALTRAGWLLSGIRRLYPRVRKELAISQQWYNNWCRQHAPKRAVPLTWHLVQGFIGLALYQKHHRLALVFLIGFAFFLRTQELLNLEPTDFKVDLADGSVVLRLASSKTSFGTQHSLALHDPLLAGLIDFLLSHIPEDEPLWTFSVSHFRATLAAFCRFFDVSHMGFIPYSLRRGGATDLYLRTNNLEVVMIQGRWKDSATARLYLDDARATLVRFNLSGSTKRLLRRFRRPLLSFLDRYANGKL